MHTTNSISVLDIGHREVSSIKEKILDLQAALQLQLPTYEALLHTIHRNLANNPDTVHLLSEEDIGIICAALSKKTGVFLTKEITDKSSKKKAKIDLSDL
jgi:hypothetical protein